MTECNHFQLHFTSWFLYIMSGSQLFVFAVCMAACALLLLAAEEQISREAFGCVLRAQLQMGSAFPVEFRLKLPHVTHNSAV